MEKTYQIVIRCADRDIATSVANMFLVSELAVTVDLLEVAEDGKTGKPLGMSSELMHLYGEDS